MNKSRMKSVIFMFYKGYINFMYVFFPIMIRNSLSRRKGKCKMCGYCCGSCFYLKNNKCKVYNQRPKFCSRDAPLNKFELKYIHSPKCGYYFEDRLR